MRDKARKYDSAESRWAGVGPYYAMFPASFADSVVKQYTEPGDVVLDPFAGRGTAVFSAAAQGRIGVGIEVNPVGWVYAKAKLRAAKEDSVSQRIDQFASQSPAYSEEAKNLPPFFKRCFSLRVRQFLVAARAQLDWRRRTVDWTTMALLLVYLHGKRGDSLSNQMRQTKSMSPPYAISWWNARKMLPPNIDPAQFMQKRIRWRFAKGPPKRSKSRVYLGDSNRVLRRVAKSLGGFSKRPVRLLFTSPPYYGVTNYHYDQWLRLWLLGFSPVPVASPGRYSGRFGDRAEYRNLLNGVFQKASRLLRKDGVVYVRTDGRQFTYDTTIDVLQAVFPEKNLTVLTQPFRKPTQTHLFGDKTPKIGEVDIILQP